MTKAFIQYNEKKSIDFGLVLMNEVEHESTSNDIETIIVPGRDGVLLRDKKRLNPVEKAFPFLIRSDVNLTKTQEDIADWLTASGYHELKLSWDNEYIYLATVLQGFSIQELLRAFGKLRVSFLVHPIKFLVSGIRELTLTKGQLLANEGRLVAKPIITLTGSGNCDLTINGRTTKLKNIQGSITLDMQKNVIYHGVLPAWDKVERSTHSQLPYLDKGNNTITWTGNFTVKIRPYWAVKV